MTAKSYLKQIEIMNNKINTKIQELCESKQLAYSTGALSNDERVKSSGSQDRMGNDVVRIVDMENAIDDMIDTYVDYKYAAIKEIRKLNDEKMKQVLYERYIEFKTYEDIAKDMHMTRSGAYKLHNRAIEEFMEIYNTIYCINH